MAKLGDKFSTIDPKDAKRQKKESHPRKTAKTKRTNPKPYSHNRKDDQTVLGNMNQRLPILSATFLAVVFQPLCFAESIQSIGSGEESHYLEFNRSRSINAIDYGLLSGSSIDQSSMLARAIKYACGNKEVDCVYVPEGTYQFTHSIWLKAGLV